jgi:hypothetical protein
MNAIIGYDSGQLKTIASSYGVTTGPRFLWAETIDDNGPSIVSIVDLINELKSQIAFYKKSRMKVYMQSKGIHRIDVSLGSYITTMNIPDQSVVLGAEYSISKEWASVTPNAVLNKVTWNFNTNTTSIYTDYKNYG